MSRDADVAADLEARMHARSVPIPEDLVGGASVYRLGRMVRLKRKGSPYIRAAIGRAVVPIDAERRLIHYGCRCRKELESSITSQVMSALEHGYTFCPNRGGGARKQ